MREKNRLGAAATRTEPVPESCSCLAVPGACRARFVPRAASAHIAVHRPPPAGSVPVPPDAGRGGHAAGTAAAIITLRSSTTGDNAANALTLPMEPGTIEQCRRISKKAPSTVCARQTFITYLERIFLEGVSSRFSCPAIADHHWYCLSVHPSSMQHFKAWGRQQWESE